MADEAAATKDAAAKTAAKKQQAEADAARLIEAKQERSVLRGVATTMLTTMLNAYEAALASEREIDDLAFTISEAEECFRQLADLRDELGDLGVEDKSGHLSELKKALFGARRRLSRAEAALAAPAQATTVDGSGAGSSAGSQGLSDRANLPKLSLPKFAGQFEDWPSFWDQFRSLVHDRELPPVDKLIYLKSSLVGEAAASIQQYTTSAANYEPAMAALRKRYGSPQLLIGLFASRLLDMRPVQDGDLDGFRTLVQGFSNSLRQIKALGAELSGAALAEGGLPDLLLAPMLLKNLPPAAALLWTRAHSQDRYDLEALLKFSEEEVQGLEALEFGRRTERSRTEASRPRESTSLAYGPGPRRSARASPTVAALVVSSPRGRVCRCCDRESHPFVDCPRYMGMTPSARKDELRRLQRCLRCLASHDPGHNCLRPGTCGACNGAHHWSVCVDTRPTTPRPGARPRHPPTSGPSHGPHSPVYQAPAEPASRTPVLSTVPALTSTVPDPDEPCVFVRMARARLSNPSTGRWVYVHVYVDEGAQRSYIRDDVARTLDLELGPRRDMETGGFYNSVHKHRTQMATFNLEGPGGTLSLRAWTVDQVCPPIRQERLQPLPPSLTNLGPWADEYDGGTRQISVLIGADQTQMVLGGSASYADAPTITATLFGLMPFGPYWGTRASSGVSPALFLHSTVDGLWTLEGMGIPDDEGTGAYPNAIRTPDGSRYRVRLPFRGNKRPLNNSVKSSRTQAAIARGRSEDLTTAKLEKLDQDGVIEPADTPDSVGFFLPHHVVRGRKPRLVFNGAAEDPDGKSLNAFLDPGPNLLAPMVDVLLRFRLHVHVKVADIKAAFHQVELHPLDRRWAKLWWGKESWQFVRVPFGLSSSPYLLHSTIRFHVAENGTPDLRKGLEESLFCDDLVRSSPDRDGLERFFDDATALLKDAGMELLPVENPAKILGVGWNAVADSLSVDLTKIQPPAGKVTRRILLAEMGKAFDPLGLLSPWTLRPKLILQQAWLLGGEWDTPLPPSLAQPFLTWVAEARDEGPDFPRCVHASADSTLHVFCDASSTAFGFVAYVTRGGAAPVLLAAKARVAPLKPAQTIPRLELLGAVLGARFAEGFCSNVSTPKRTVFWTDATCVLQWIAAGPSRRDVFVNNRLATIATATQTCRGSWRHIPTADNPADIVSRGASLAVLRTNVLYNLGPLFLRSGGDDESTWPEPPSAPPALLTVGEASDGDASDAKPEGLALAPYATAAAALRTCAWMRRFVYNSRHARTPVRGPLSYAETQEALRFLIQQEQEQHYGPEIRALRALRTVLRCSSIWRLHPALLDGTVVLTPRTGEAPVPILPPRSRLTELLVERAHSDMLHQGPDATLAQLRETFWLPHGRSTVRRLVHACPKCRRYEAMPYRSSEATLRDFRATPAAPFTTTGLDFFGPLSTTDQPKVYVLLLTCASTRALHLELVKDLTAASAHLAIRRFLARRLRLSQPVTFYSDNARTFVKLSAARFPQPVTWKFIPARSPHWGGWWERLVKAVKRSLRIVHHGRRMPYADLEAALTEAEAALNSRPLTAASDEPRDVRAITPADLLLGSAPSHAADGPHERSSADGPPAALRGPELRDARARKDVGDELFWQTWRRVYLAALRTWRTPGGRGRLPTVGEVVLVHEAGRRSTWPLARVTALRRGRDGQPRTASLRLNGRETTRAVHLLYPLEAEATHATVEFRESAPDVGV